MSNLSLLQHVLRLRGRRNMDWNLDISVLWDPGSCLKVVFELLKGWRFCFITARWVWTLRFSIQTPLTPEEWGSPYCRGVGGNVPTPRQGSSGTLVIEASLVLPCGLYWHYGLWRVASLPLDGDENLPWNHPSGERVNFLFTAGRRPSLTSPLAVFQTLPTRRGSGCVMIACRGWKWRLCTWSLPLWEGDLFKQSISGFYIVVVPSLTVCSCNTDEKQNSQLAPLKRGHIASLFEKSEEKGRRANKDLQSRLNLLVPINDRTIWHVLTSQ